MTDDSRPIPQTRPARAAGLGRLTTTTLASAALGASRQMLRGQRPDARSVFLTPGNITRLADELSRMRGAAMKLGQLLSMETHDLLPPELAAIMARLRALLQATITGEDFRPQMIANGYAGPETTNAQWQTLEEIATLVRGPLSADHPFDFGKTATLGPGPTAGATVDPDRGV